MNRILESLNIVPHLVESQEELTKLIQDFIEKTDVQFNIFFARSPLPLGGSSSLILSYQSIG